MFTALHLKHRNYSRPVILIDQKGVDLPFNRCCNDILQPGDEYRMQVCPRYVDLLEGNGITFVHGYIEEIDLLERHIRLESDGDYAL